MPKFAGSTQGVDAPTQELNIEGLWSAEITSELLKWLLERGWSVRVFQVFDEEVFGSNLPKMVLSAQREMVDVFLDRKPGGQ